MHVFIAVESVLLRSALIDYIDCMMPDTAVTILDVSAPLFPVIPIDVAIINKQTFPQAAMISGISKIIDPATDMIHGRWLRRLCMAERARARQRTVFTAMERQVLRHVMAGLSNKEIAALTGISLANVKLHIRRLCTRTDTRNRTQLALLAQQMDD